MWFQTKPFLLQFSLLSYIILWLQFLCRYTFLLLLFCFWSIFVWWLGVFLGFFFIFLLPDGLKYLWFGNGGEITLVVSGSSTFSNHPKPLEVTLCFQVLIGSCWASVPFELGPFGRTHLLYLLWPIFPAWTWPFGRAVSPLSAEVVLQDGGISRTSLVRLGDCGYINSWQHIQCWLLKTNSSGWL